MTKVRVFLMALVVLAATTLLSAAPAAASSCPYGKVGCAAYYKVCQVAYEAGVLHCID
jgi:hypothetical protein